MLDQLFFWKGDANQITRNEKDYSHEGLGAIIKSLNGDHLTKVTSPPKWL